MGLGIAAFGRELTYRNISRGMINAMRMAYSAFLFTFVKIKNHCKGAVVELRLKKFYCDNLNLCRLSFPADLPFLIAVLVYLFPYNKDRIYFSGFCMSYHHPGKQV